MAALRNREIDLTLTSNPLRRRATVVSIANQWLEVRPMNAVSIEGAPRPFALTRRI